jgi:hypothetical protein
MYAIEDDVPPPGGTPGRPVKYPFLSLNVGQSFFVPLGDRRTISVCASRVGGRLKRQFVVRQVEGGVRAWRLK